MVEYRLHFNTQADTASAAGSQSALQVVIGCFARLPDGKYSILDVWFPMSRHFLKLNIKKCQVMSFGRNVDKTSTYSALDHVVIR